MRVVVDTNVLVSSFPGGNPRRIIDLWKKGKITLCLTNAIIEEYVGVLKRMGFIGVREIDELLFLFRKQYGCVYSASARPLRVCKDPDDNKFVEAAVELNATVVISGDDHLKSLKEYAGIMILSPQDFIKQFPSPCQET